MVSALLEFYFLLSVQICIRSLACLHIQFPNFEYRGVFNHVKVEFGCLSAVLLLFPADEGKICETQLE